MNLQRKLEFVCLFIGIPILLRLEPVIAQRAGVDLNIPIIPVLIIIAGFVLLVMRRTTPFKLSDIVEISTVTRRNWILMLTRFVILATLLTLALAWYKPEGLFRLPRERTGLWIMVMCFYPLASVIPQGIVYRAFYRYRYAKLFPPALQTIAGAAMFSFAHLPFANRYAIAFTLLGGLMFLSSYKRTKSLLFSSIEHALYGTFIFTVGWGEFFFYAGTLRLLERV